MFAASPHTSDSTAPPDAAPRGRFLKVVVGVVSTLLFVLYPVAIWVGLTHFSARTIGLWILALMVPAMVIRYRKARREDLLTMLRVPLLVLALVLLSIVLDDERFVLAMPVLVNVGLLVTFASSLRGTPIIERFARAHDPDGMTSAKIAHCRQVTAAWCGFFSLNALTAAGLALFAPVSVWAAYNGGIAYALMGLMFAGEYVVRSYRFRRYGGGLHDRLLSRMFPPEKPMTDEDRSADES